MNKETLNVKGFFRVALVNAKTGKVEGLAEGHNAVTEDGFDNYIVGAVGAIAGSKQVTHLQLATQTAAPNSTQQTASGEFGTRKAANKSLTGNGTLQVTASWATNENTQSTLGAIALYNTSAGGTAGGIATFSTSNKTTDQTLNATYEWRFS